MDWTIVVSNPHKEGSGIKAFTTYLITTLPCNVSTRRRFSEFALLYTKLSATIDTLPPLSKPSLPPLPKKSYFGRFDERTVELRRQMLGEILQTAVRYTETVCLPELLEFLELPVAILPTHEVDGVGPINRDVMLWTQQDVEWFFRKLCMESYFPELMQRSRIHVRRPLLTPASTSANADSNGGGGESSVLGRLLLSIQSESHLIEYIPVREIGLRRRLLTVLQRIRQSNNKFNEDMIPVHVLDQWSPRVNQDTNTDVGNDSSVLSSSSSGHIPAGRRFFVHRRVALAERHVMGWSSENVGEWLEAMGLSKYATLFQQDVIDGVALITLTDDDLQVLGVGKSDHRKDILRAIGGIAQNNFYLPATSSLASNPTSAKKTNKGKSSNNKNDGDAVLPKLAALAKRCNFDESELRQLCRNLGTVEGIKSAYLNKDFEAIKKMYESLPATEPSSSSSSSSSVAPMSSTSSASFRSHATVGIDAAEGANSTDDAQIDFETDSVFEEPDIDIQRIEKQQRTTQYNNKSNKVKIKLIIAEIAHTSAQRSIRRVLSPIITNFNVKGQKFGMFHSALCVGPWYLEWVNSSLCIPRKCYSNAAILAVDIDEGKLGNHLDLDWCIDKVSRVIVDWNCNKTYDRSTNNCQTFVDALCEALGIDLSTAFQGSMGEYLTNLRARGVSEMIYRVPADVRETCDIRESEVRFETHEQLDLFIANIIDKDCLFQEKYREDWLLLKSFDRAFWLRHYKSENDPRYRPHVRLGVLRCPYGDPQQSNSFKKEWW